MITTNQIPTSENLSTPPNGFQRMLRELENKIVIGGYALGVGTGLIPPSPQELALQTTTSINQHYEPENAGAPTVEAIRVNATTLTMPIDDSLVPGIIADSVGYIGENGYIRYIDPFYLKSQTLAQHPDLSEVIPKILDASMNDNFKIDLLWLYFISLVDSTGNNLIYNFEDDNGNPKKLYVELTSEFIGLLSPNSGRFVAIVKKTDPILTIPAERMALIIALIESLEEAEAKIGDLARPLNDGFFQFLPMMADSDDNLKPGHSIHNIKFDTDQDRYMKATNLTYRNARASGRARSSRRIRSWI